jgi:hypothetical protein
MKLENKYINYCPQCCFPGVVLQAFAYHDEECLLEVVMIPSCQKLPLPILLQSPLKICLLCVVTRVIEASGAESVQRLFTPDTIPSITMYEHLSGNPRCYGFLVL